MNINQLAEKIIQEKQKLFTAIQGKKESEYDKNRVEMWEDYIIEAQEEYTDLCHVNNIQPSEAVLSWNF